MWITGGVFHISDWGVGNPLQYFEQKIRPFYGVGERLRQSIAKCEKADILKVLGKQAICRMQMFGRSPPEERKRGRSLAVATL